MARSKERAIRFLVRAFVECGAVGYLAQMRFGLAYFVMIGLDVGPEGPDRA
jgi:hypothetical protein